MNIQQILKQLWALILATIISILSMGFAIYSNNPDWAIAGLTFALIIITAHYAYLTHKQVELQEKDRKIRVISELSRNVFSKIKRKLLRVQKELNKEGYICDDKDAGLKVCGETKELELLINECISSKRLILVSDEVLNRHWPKIRGHLLNYKENLASLENSIKEIADYFLRNENLIGFIEKLIKDYGNEKLMNSFVYRQKEIIGRIIYGILSNKEELPYTSLREFWREYKNLILRKFSEIEPNIKDKIQNWKDNRVRLIGTVSALLNALDNLFEEWIKEYSLTEAELGLLDNEL